MTPPFPVAAGARAGRPAASARAQLLGATRGWLPPIMLAAALLLAWEEAARVSGISPLVLPRPSAVGRVLITQTPLYLRHSLVTGIEMVAGFLLASILGVGFGVVIASSPPLGRACYPLLVSAQVVPKVAIAPLLILWLGFDIAPKVALVVLIAFFPIVVNTAVGLNMPGREDLYLFRSMGAGAAQTFLKLRLPKALPVVFAGLKVAATLAVIGAVVGEFSGGNAGLGYLLLIQAGRLDMAAAFGSVACLTLMGLAFFALVAAVERLVVPARRVPGAKV